MATVLDMSMSLDGFVAGPNERPDNGLGDGGERLHEWIFPAPDHKAAALSGVNREVFDELMATGAVVAGRGTVEPADYWNGDHHDGVPIFILSRTRTESRWPLVRFMDDVRAAMTEATGAAGEKDVLVHGVTVARLALAAGVLDELQVHVVPVLLGRGRRLFEEQHAELERVRVLAGEDGIVHVRYRIRR
ncbi:dihydrofolate reductase [Solirubrobacter pauli]|uniref:Dihydrofolate reductase n=1 Tax=Solirubrobacter pauli TaxID=166793 RepID=A0A660KWB7_9ACTN|nr:dihydrofolate reductase family protein [Solirubrobacter pauli]RKQ86007.1 dihydrofolate reductase [Solirubrobacter pauli]